MRIFRDEVRQAQSSQWLGAVRLYRPLSATVMTLFAAVAALLFVSFALWGDIHRKARLSGLVVPLGGSLAIAAPQAGIVKNRLAAEGAEVEAGDVLLTLTTDHRTASGETSALVEEQIRVRLSSLQDERRMREQQLREKAQLLAERQTTFASQLRQVDDEIRLQTRRVQLAKGSLERQRQLVSDGFVSPAQAQGKEEDLLDTEGKLQTLERTRTSLQQDHQALLGDAQSARSQSQADLALLERSIASLSQERTENKARNEGVVTAPVNGVITALELKPGQAVLAGQTLATLVPRAASGADARSGLEAYLFASSTTAGFIQPGQKVYIRYAAFPYQKFGLQTGHVSAVSASPFVLGDLPASMSQQLNAGNLSTQPLYRVQVSLDSPSVNVRGVAHPIKAGMALEADVLQERRKIWEWVLEPVLAAHADLKVLGAGK